MDHAAELRESLVDRRGQPRRTSGGNLSKKVHKLSSTTVLGRAAVACSESLWQGWVGSSEGGSLSHATNVAALSFHWPNLTKDRKKV